MNVSQRKPHSVMFSTSTKSSGDSQQRSTMNNRKRRVSSAVPIPDAMFRSPSELQLSVAEQVADERDYAFYARLMYGIRERRRAANQKPYDHLHYFNEETERCLTHIMQTRHQKERAAEEQGVPILSSDDWTQNGASTGYYLEDLDCLTSSSSSFSSSSTYQQDFEQDHDEDAYSGETECIFDLEL